MTTCTGTPPRSFAAPAGSRPDALAVAQRATAIVSGPVVDSAGAGWEIEYLAEMTDDVALVVLDDDWNKDGHRSWEVAREVHESTYGSDGTWTWSEQS